MSVNSFAPCKFQDFTIVDAAGKKVCSVRVKPSGILYAPKGSHRWYGISLAKFGEFMEANGTLQKK